MSHAASTVAVELREALADWAPVDVVRFFGGDGLRLDGTQFAAVIQGQVWLTVDDALRAALQAAGGGEPFTYGKSGGRQVTVRRFGAMPASAWDDRQSLAQWCRLSWEVARRAAATPAAKLPRTAKARTTKRPTKRPTTRA
ncbi:TfoX/Sxy family protein [Ideonella sp.]|uniref:TfoX/Sxy family protein n=1 Tax=Ideonella sp. TaxID=1929293 RepID=UPI0035AD957D